jgi:hypothetical protein
MKKKIFIPCLGLLAAFALAFMFTACPNPNGSGGDPELTGTVDLANQTVSGATFKMGDTARATVNNSNANTFNYQWQKRTGNGAWTNIPSATTGTYTIASPVAAGDSIKVVVKADDFSGSRESDAVTVTEDPNVGENEVKGKIFYMDAYTKAVFSDSTFEASTWEVVDDTVGWEDSVYHWAISATGSYRYNSEEKTVTATVSQIMMKDAEGNPKLMNKSQAQNAVAEYVDAQLAWLWQMPLWMLPIEFGVVNIWDLGFEFDYFGDERWGGMDWDEAYDMALAEWLEENEDELKLMMEEELSGMGITTHEQAFEAMLEMSVADYKSYMRDQIGEAFNPQTFTYEFTEDGYMLGQQVLPANKGTDELKGQPFSNFDTYETVTFAASGLTYTTNAYEPVAGNYAYDSTKITVWLQPTTIGGKTMAEYCEDYPYGWSLWDEEKFASEDEYKAAQTNEAFTVRDYFYDTTRLRLSNNEPGGPDDGGIEGYNTTALRAKPPRFK